MIDFKNKKVTIMGLGQYESGSGISATKFLVGAGAKVLVTDLQSEEKLKDQIKRLGGLTRKIEFVLGRHRMGDFKNIDLVVRNPGVPKSSKYLKEAKKNNIPIVNDISIFFDLVDRKRVIGVTGTRGKSTTVSLINEILKLEDKNTVLGGNITKSPLAQLDKVKRGGPVVLELSSWLLEDVSVSSYISVVTNIYPDHLNTYNGMGDYVKAKERIWNFQNAQDAAVLNYDNKYTKSMGQRVPSRRYWFSLKEFKNENGCFVRGGKIWFREGGREQQVLGVSDIKVPGEHNLANVLAAVTVAMVYGVGVTKIKKAIKGFNGIENRLELIRTISGIKYYNDTTSTTPEATIAALTSFSNKKNIVLIMGGSDKKLKMNKLFVEIKKHCQAVVLLPGSGTDRLGSKIIDLRVNVANVDSMINAVGVAKSLARRGDVILLSPAFASFGLFKNEFDRGDQFTSIVKKL